MKNINVKMVGITATALGFASTLMSNWVSNKQMEMTVNEKVGKAMQAYLENKK